MKFSMYSRHFLRAALAAVLVTIPALSEAKITVKEPWSDGMVLQQQSNPLIKGHATKGSTITVTTSWNGKSYKTTTDETGVWQVNVTTPAASYRNYSVKASGDGSTLTIKDVLIGEVWIAGGQSNMEMPIRGFFNCPVEGASEVISAPQMRDKIRMFTVQITPRWEPSADVIKTSGWEKADCTTVSEMSATAYFFARKINASLDVPVGIVALPRGGSRVESWLSRQILESFGIDCDPSKLKLEGMWTPYAVYNGMQRPVQKYTAKGFIWYQGCSNVGDEDTFVNLMSSLVALWRKGWGDEDNSMPFYMVEIAPYQYKGSQCGKAALLRKAQHDAAKVIPNCDIVCTNDLVYPYEVDNIHPCQKEQVGTRLAFLALNRDYGWDKVACHSPEAIRAYRPQGKESEICLELSNCPNGMNRWIDIEGLEVCGSEGIFKKVTYAYYEWGKFLRIRCEGVFDPCRVRYGWGDFRPGNLKNAEGLPLVPFDISIEQ